MKLVICCYIFLMLVSRSYSADQPIYISSLNEDSDPNDNITEVASVYEVAFSCSVSEIANLSPAKTVHELRPTDVKVVGAIGDSMTAALFAKVSNVLGILPGLIDKHVLEYRGVSWSIGGDSGATTLPNLIKNYSPDLTGFSIKTGKEGTSNAAYNFAVSGAVASDLLSQAQLLVNRIRADGLDDEWKVVTLFIGGNDLCAICNDRDKFSKENFYLNIKRAIDKLSELKKIFVNLVQTVEVSKVATLPSLGCGIIQALIKIAGTCKCVDSDLSSDQNDYKEEINALETFYSEQTPERDDFVVVVQPFFGITNIPTENPLSYFAPDCFHLSQLGLVQAAVALWNNMLQPVGSKTDEFEVNQLLICPSSSSPYFFTHKNSGSVSTHNLGGTPNQDTSGSLSAGQTAGVVVGTLLLVAAAVGILVGGALGYYLKNRRPRFSQYVSLSKAASV